MIDYSVYSAELAIFNCDIGLLKIPKTRISSHIAPLAGVHKARFGCANPILRYAKPAKGVLKPRVVERGFTKPCFGTESPPAVLYYYVY